MRILIVATVLVAIASAGSYALISVSRAAAGEERAATFAERFAPALEQTCCGGVSSQLRQKLEAR